jgi:hypothetical protein
MAFDGFRPREQLEPTRAVFRHEEFTQPDYRRTALYNEFFRPLKLEQGVLIQLPSRVNRSGKDR